MTKAVEDRSPGFEKEGGAETSEREEQVARLRPEVTFSVRVSASDGPPKDELVRTIRSLLAPIRGTAGCLRCKLVEDVQETNELQLLVEWRRERDFIEHVRTPLFRRVLACLELSAEPPDFHIRTVSGERGMELLQEILRCGDK